MLLLNLVQKEYANPEGLFGHGLEKAVGNELDKLLCITEAKTSTEDPSTGLQTQIKLAPRSVETKAGLHKASLTSDEVLQTDLISKDLPRGPGMSRKG